MGHGQTLVIQLRLPVLEVIFSIVQDLSSLCAVVVRALLLAGHNGAVVEELEETATVTGQDDLLLGTLDCGKEFGVVGLLELFTSLTSSCQSHTPGH